MRSRPNLLLVIILLASLLAACGGGDDGDDEPEATSEAGAQSTSLLETGGPESTGEPSGDGVATGESQPGQETPTGGEGVTEQATMPADDGPKLPANELGQIPILEYHHLGPVPEQFVRTPDQFRADLQWLYDHDFYVINLHDILDDTIDVPTGKRPVALTFDDSPASQFNLIPLSDGRLAVDPNSAVGIMERFFIQHPDFGRGGHFTVLPDRLFDWAPVEDRSDQSPYSQDKMDWLVAHGYEIGNHTLDHANLVELTPDEVKYQLAEANIAIHKILPDVPIRVITLPYGMYPAGGDDTLFRGFDYQGGHYEWDAALLVGANPTVSPISTEYDPYATARIQAFDEELHKWFEVFSDQPGILYVSDGDPNTVTVPEDLHPWLVGTLDMSKIGNRELIRY